jgi:ethanolamine phosphate transferase 2 subunit G
MVDSPNMPAKQSEMDEVVREIYHAMEKYDHLASSLLVLSGDHGMNEAGNHGGSSSGEVSTALLFISPKFTSTFTGFESPLAGSENFEFYGRIEQSDIAPTLAALLGFPVPRNNLGIIIPPFLELWAQGA